MFIELAEFLRCVADHEETYCVVVPDEVAGRTVVRGTIGCPVCRREYRIRDAVADFAPERSAPTHPAAPDPLPADAQTIQALMNITGPGGYAVLIGSAARLGTALSGLVGGVHFVGVNAPADVEPGPAVSLLQSPGAVPLRSGMARAVVVGPEHAAVPWLAEGARVLLRRLRYVVLAEGARPPDVEELAVGQGLWVGERV